MRNLKIAFFDAKPYDKPSFEEGARDKGYQIKYFETKLNEDTVELANGFVEKNNKNEKRTLVMEEFEKLKQIIADVLSVDPEEVKMETTFMDDLGADSLDVYQIIMGIEEEFDIEVSEELAENIKTVEEAVELIKNAMN